MALKYSNDVLVAWNKALKRPTTPPQVETARTPVVDMTVENVDAISLMSSPVPPEMRTPVTSSEAYLQNWLLTNNLIKPKMTPIEPAQVAEMTVAQTQGLDTTDNTQALLNALNTQTQSITEIENARLKRAAQQNAFSAVTRIGSTIIGGLEMNDYADEVAATKEQYEVQKKIIDTNIQNSEALLMERYRESMADLDAITASKNVDPTSGAIQGIKEKGAMDMGKDFAIQRSNAEIQKLALDLDYARSNRIASRQRRNYWEAAGWDIAKTGINYLIGG